MSRRYLFVSLSVLFTCGIVATAAAKDVIPAGTILHCTMDEPNFSAKTAMVGDPVLCHLGPLGSFGHSVFPRGALLGGHLQDYKNPGHFVGKGWMAIEFDRMILPGAEILPLSAKVISAPRMKVDAQGDIHGRGHPKRDAILWAFPPLWPIKVLTLPARGPFPTLKGENRLSLRLMEDVEVPFPTSAQNAVPAPSWTNPSSYNSNAPALYQPASIESNPAPELQPRPQVRQIAYSQPVEARVPRPQITIVALHGGGALLARNYWVEGTKLVCVSSEGVERELPLDMIDLAQTVKMNQERNVEFSLHSRNGSEQ